MKDKYTKFNIIRFNITANALLKMPIKGIDDVRKFYIGINNLASQISSSDIIKKLSLIDDRDKTKLLNAVYHILGYGRVIEKTEFFQQKTINGKPALKEINLDTFLEKNSQARSTIQNIQKNAGVYFKKFSAVSDETMKDNTASIREHTAVMKELIKVIKNGHIGGGFVEGALQQKKDIAITYAMGIGQLVFNGKDTVNVDGKQKDVVDRLIEAGKKQRVSWEAIYETIENPTGEILDEYKTKQAKKMINGAVTEINKKTEKYLEPKKLLIGFKENEYWLQYEVRKDG